MLFLRYIFFDGEPLSPASVSLWFQSHDNHLPKLINMYGITEATVHLTHCEITSDKLIAGLRYPLGKGFSGVSLYVLDHHLQPVPLGIPGELYVAGPWLARGYCSAELTQKNFITTLLFNEFKRLYKTGDWVRRLDNGELDYLARLDNQVKIRGHRIDLDEISMRIEEFPPIAQAAVILNISLENYPKIIAYLLLKKGIAFNVGELRTHLKHYLPEYMLPAFFISLENLPLTNNGKVDKVALPKPNQASFLMEEPFIAPRNSVELKLAEIWREVLGLEKVSILDNFFILGGHSLLALQMLLKIKQHFNLELPIRSILDASTISETAEIIENQLINEKFTYRTTKQSAQTTFLSSIVPLQPLGNKTPIFLVHPVGGTVFWYTTLIKYFYPDQPLYGIQDPGVEKSNQVVFNCSKIWPVFIYKHCGMYSLRGHID